jgi:hypothetical protein
MASAFAHELNQPLSAISSYLRACQILLARPDDQRALLVETMDKVVAEAGRAGQVVHRWPVDPAQFFADVVQHVSEGYYADPGNGGNRNEAAWHMIGLGRLEVKFGRLRRDCGGQARAAAWRQAPPGRQAGAAVERGSRGPGDRRMTTCAASATPATTRAGLERPARGGGPGGAGMRG